MSRPLPRIGARIALRRLAESDLAAFQAYRNDEETGRYQGWMAQPDDIARAFLEEMRSTPLLVAGHWIQLGIADGRSDELIGDLGLCVLEDGTEAEIGFTLRPESRGMGLGAEAVREAMALIFQWTGVARIIAVSDARNLASIRLLKRVGMSLVATDRALFRGEPNIEQTYAIDRPEDDPRDKVS